MNKKNKIVILITYFGNLPWYFSYYLHSCSYNKEIDFIIFSDSKLKYNLPKNVLMFYKSLSDIKNITSDKLGFEVALNSAYKLCDFKPVYGLIFEDYITEYHFWGQSDIDIIYGNLKSFFTNELLNLIDYASVRHDYTTGCFSLFRNNKLINNLFKKSKDYKKVFTTKKYLGFDELNFRHCEINEKGKSLNEIKTNIECFTHIVRKTKELKEIKPYFDFILLEGVPGKIKFDNGQLIYNDKFEVALYHLYWLKKIYHPKTIPKKIPNIYFISPTKIYKKYINNYC